MRGQTTEGKGAHSSRSSILVALLTTLALLAFAPLAQADHGLEWAAGTQATGVLGDQFNQPQDSAVLESVGDVYVADSANNRVQRFSSSGDFEMAWGGGVVAAGGSGDLGGSNEKQTVKVSSGASAFTLRWSPFPGPEQSTASLPAASSAASVQAALEGLGYIEPGDVIVTGPDGGPFTVEFAGTYAATNVALIDISGGTVTETTPAVPAFEICTVASQCRPGSATSPSAGGGGVLSLPTGIAVNQSTGEVYVAESKGGRVSVFDQNGVWQRSFGWDVVQAGKPGNLVGANEKQRVTIVSKSGAFRLSLPGIGQTISLPINASAAEVEAALIGMENVAPGDVSVIGAAGGPWTIDFGGAFAGTDVSRFDLVSHELVVQEAVNNLVETLVNGAAYEICTVATDCQRGSDGESAGQLAHNPTKLPTFNVPFDGPSILSHLDRVGIAIDQQSGDVYVGDVGNDRISHYDEAGNFLRSFGWGVDTNTDALEVCTAASTCQRRFIYEPQSYGEPANGKFRGDLVDIAFDSESKVLYAAALGGATSGFHQPPTHVFRFDTTGSTAGELLLPLTILQAGSPVGWPSNGTLDDGLPAGLEVDPDSGHVFLLTSPRSVSPLGFVSGQSVQEIDPTTASATVAARHVLITEPGWTVRVGGLGFDGSTDRLYLSGGEWRTGVNGFQNHPHFIQGSLLNMPNQLFALSHTPAPAPSPAAEPVTNIDAHSATLNGTVTPNGPEGVDTLYHFEYRADGSPTWLRAPTNDKNAGDGTTLVAVFEDVTGLEAATLYHVRVVARRAFGEEIVSAEQTFTTTVEPPVVETVYPQARYDTGIRLTGLINPNGAPTSYRFEWGETAAYGSSFPVPDGIATGGKTTLITEELFGLQPETTYHYRLVADNGIEEAPGDTLVEGEDVSFTTRPTYPADPKRSFEMVSPPFKLTRSTVRAGGEPGRNANPGWPSLDGEKIRWKIDYLPLLESSGMPFNGEKLITRRTEDGWETEALHTLPILPEYDAKLKTSTQFASSGDLETQAWEFEGLGGPAPILPNEGEGPLIQYTRKEGTGVKGFTGWLDNVDTQQVSDEDEALFNDDGSAMARWGGYRGLGDDPDTEADEDRSDDLQLPGEESGRTAYLQLDPPNGIKDLIGECTGSGSSATQIPERDANGTGLASDDFIDVRTCAANNLTSKWGAIVGSARGGQFDRMAGNAVTALADDGRRVFFTSPDSVVPDPSALPFKRALLACTPTTAANTICPPQLFVRSYDAEGNPTVRWVSRSRSVAGPDNSYSGAQITKQAIALMGPSTFEGASRDGSTVYFRTNSPLTPDDPNGTGSPGPVTTGAASAKSWDLYRYELPASHEADPDGGSLTRISGGPSGEADPSTNSTPGISEVDGGKGGAARYISDDGKRAYFVTGAPITGADETAPKGGATVPGGTPVNGTTRNLYLYDDTGEAAEWRFVAQIPLAFGRGGSNAFDACASSQRLIGPSSDLDAGRIHTPGETSCVRGTRDGGVLVFMSHGQLTEDDTDEAADIYLYDAEADELVRVSTPPTGIEGYACRETATAEGFLTDATCNAELGHSAYASSYDLQRGWGGARQFNITEEPSGAVSVNFESRSQLLDEDENIDEWDVYRWREGELELLSSGDPGKHSYYSGSSLDGEDIFIWTNSRIDPREVDEDDYDIYDLRIGEGFPPPEVSVPCDVLALDCEKAATPPPPVVPPGGSSLTLQGAGNPTEPAKRCLKGQVRRKGKCVKRKARKQRAGKGRKGGRR